MKTKHLICIGSALMFFTACQDNTAITSSQSQHQSDISDTVTQTEITELTTIETLPEYEYSESDKMAAEWFSEYMSDSESFTDVTDYQYYARTLGLEKDAFLSADMWEVYYNSEININRDIDCKDIYLIRLNPNKLMEIYAQNNNTSVDNLCKNLSVTREQLYYNWGYNPSSIDYEEEHKEHNATYSDEEKNIFGDFNGEDRADVMSTHMLEVSFDGEVIYSSDVSDRLQIKRRDLLGTITDNECFYSAYSETEKAAQFTVNGIGIRTVIPLTIPNARNDESADQSITPMINVSPYAYGCTDGDIIDIVKYLEQGEE